MKDENGDFIPTSPKLSKSEFVGVEGEVPKLVARRNKLVHRKNLLANVRKTDGESTGLLNLLRNDGRVTAGAIVIGTNTHRCRHINVVNIPSVDALYGDRIRELFTVQDGYSMVGVDAAALEARMQAHYVYPFTGGEALADLLINGDIHQANADLWGCTRKQAKPNYYCLMYGGQPAKLASTMGCSLKDAKGYYEQFWQAYTPLTEFKDTITKIWEERGGKKGGYLKAIHGAKLFARSPHALVNMMFQSAGSITVMYATIFLDKLLKENMIDAHQVIHMHDEFQIEVVDKDVETVRDLALKSFEYAGKYLKMNVPILGDAKVGKNWRDTH
jgi:DNA polymerase I-like protein with 3'-5' exonuclease and polymerase domains